MHKNEKTLNSVYLKVDLKQIQVYFWSLLCLNRDASARI